MSEVLPEISEVRKCKDARCAMPIVYREMFGGPHPFDVVVEDNKVVEVRGSHFDTCEYASNFRPPRKGRAKPVQDDLDETEIKGAEFDFEKWFRWRFSRHTPDGEERRPGTFTINESDLLTDLVYDYARRCGGKEKKAKAICQQAIKAAKCLAVDERGYYLKGQPRIRFDGMWRIIDD